MNRKAPEGRTTNENATTHPAETTGAAETARRPAPRSWPVKSLFWTALIAAACQKPDDGAPIPMPERYAAGGRWTVYEYSTQAFSSPAPFLSGDDLTRHLQGDLEFERNFVTWPSDLGGGGLGPLYIQTSCRNCHIRDGRAQPPEPGQQLSRSLGGLLLRLSLPGADERSTPTPVPGFGGQLQTRAIFGGMPEADVVVAYQEHTVVLADGETVSLRKPVYSIVSPYREWPANAQISPRIAPPVFGLGLLEAVDENLIRALADENDADGDGVSGKPNFVWDRRTQSYRLGR
ncbi:MAG: hypothetical protein NZ534_07930, partial [Bacteroidia bacterium]|nr:hypothetical protein [Bacteroidia bacterium]